MSSAFGLGQIEQTCDRELLIKNQIYISFLNYFLWHFKIII